jgi:hypothetical protein
MILESQYSLQLVDFPPMIYGTHDAVEFCRYQSNLSEQPALFVGDIDRDCAVGAELLLAFLQPWEWTFVSLATWWEPRNSTRMAMRRTDAPVHRAPPCSRHRECPTAPTPPRICEAAARDLPSSPRGDWPARFKT